MNFIMLIGPSGCGKSTWAKNYIYDRVNWGELWDIHSSDAIRGELWGDESNQNQPAKVFGELHRRVFESFEEGHNVIYDATNLSKKSRKGFLKQLSTWGEAHNTKIHRKAVVIVTSFNDCLINNMKRTHRHVPIEVIDSQYRQIQLPWYNEGWDDIVYFTNSKNIPWGDVLSTIDIPHNNKHHPCDVLEHSLKVASVLGNPMSFDWQLGALHDFGKPFTKDFKKANGKVDGDAHYYNHHYVGAYMSLLVDGEDKYRRAMAIQYHMEPYFRDEEALEKFCDGLNDETLVQMIKTLHEADKNNP